MNTSNNNIAASAFRTYQAKLNTYISFEGKIYRSKNGKGVFAEYTEPVSVNFFDNVKIGTSGEAATLEEAYAAHQLHFENRLNERREAVHAFIAKQDATRSIEWASICELAIIPCTIENIRIVAEHLNCTNWGGWKLPKLSMGYAAHQYDCNGRQVTTITLDAPIAVDGAKVSKFKTSCPNGHLTSYYRL